jgi:hypothetical protein
MQGGEDFTGLFKNLPELQESAQGWGCIVSAEGFAYIDARLDESFNLSVKEDLNPLKKVELLDEYFSAENKEHRLQFYNAWFYLIIAELLSVFLGILFLLLALFTPLRRCKGMGVWKGVALDRVGSCGGIFFATGLNEPEPSLV